MTLKEKGSEGINWASAERVDTITTRTVPGQQVHQNCRRECCRPASMEFKKLFQTKQLVVVGGALLHRVPWPRCSPTYKEVCDFCCTCVQRKSGRAIVVFDG